MPDSSLFGAHDRGEKITVTYAASPAVLSAPLTPHFTALLQQQLPLRNLHWRPNQATLDSFSTRATLQGKSASGSSSVAPGSTIRTIQNLEVALKPLTDEIKRWRGDPGYFEQPASTELLARPFVHLYLVVCEDSEHYRVTVRNEIRSWISSLSFFHTQQAAAVAHGSSRSPTVIQSGKTSFAFGRSATPPVRPDTPQRGPESSSSPQTPASAVPIQSASLLPSFPSEPEYLIVLIAPPEGAGINGLGTPGNSAPEPKSGMGRLITKAKATVLEKIKADFNTSKKEHVIQLSRLPPVSTLPMGRTGLHSMDPTIWAELLTRMKEAASATFTTTVEAQEDEILRCSATRDQQSWDFCSYFLAKDSLARTLEGVGLKDDAVGQYEDLEQVFSNAMQNGAVSFAPVGGDSPNDDSLPLLDVAKKPYQDMIRRREISLFDFRCYLFARKSVLLAKMGRIAAVMREAPLFINAVGRMLQQNSRLSKQWIESWMFSAALDVVEQCQACLILRGHSNMSSVDDQLSPAFHSNKSELIDLARRQLDRIGIYAGHLPALQPFDVPSSAIHNHDNGSSEHVSGQNEGDAKSPSRPELLQAIDSREYFDSQYLALCERILAGWSTPSRQRSSLRIKTVLAAFDFHRHRYEIAHKSFVSLAEAYSDCKFGALKAHCLAMQLECHSRLLLTKDRDWLNSMLEALKVLSSQSRDLGNVLQKWQDAEYLVQELRAASASFDKEIPILAFPLFSVWISDARAKLANTEDGSLLSVSVMSSLPFTQEVDDVRVCLTSASKNVLWYTSLKTTLQPGETRLELFCPNPSSGSFIVDVTQIRMSKLIFQYAGPSLTDESSPRVIRIPKDGASVDVSLELPRQINLDQPRMVEIKVFSGRNDIETAEIAVQSSPDGKLAIEPNSATLTSADTSNVRIESSGASSAFVVLKQLARGTENTVLVPLAFLPESGSLSTLVTVSYTVGSTGSGPRLAAGKRRVLKKSATINTALPLGVNVQDFFRASCLLSKFTISAAGGRDSLRLRPVQLTLDGESGKGTTGSAPYSVVSCNSVRETTVTPRQPSTYVFRISKSPSIGQVAVLSPTRLRLSVEFRTLKEDAIALTLNTLDRLITAQDLAELAPPTPTRRLLDAVLATYVGDRLNLPAYSIASEVRTGSFDADWWIREQSSWGHNTSIDVPGLVQNVLEEVCTRTTQDDGLASAAWRKLTIPVEVPTMDFVHSVSVDIASSASAAAAVVDQGGPFPGHQASLVVGQPVTLLIGISSSAMWASSTKEGDESRRQMVYDVVPDFENWLVSGPKRGVFVARVASSLTSDVDFPPALASRVEPFQVQLTLVPLKTGSLTLPTVLVRPVDVVRPTQQQPDPQGDVTCETYTKNGAERVQVVPASVPKGLRSVAAPDTRKGPTQPAHHPSSHPTPIKEIAPVFIT